MFMHENSLGLSSATNPKPKGRFLGGARGGAQGRSLINDDNFSGQQQNIYVQETPDILVYTCRLTPVEKLFSHS